MDWGYISVAEHLLIMYEALGLASVLKGAGDQLKGCGVS